MSVPENQPLCAEYIFLLPFNEATEISNDTRARIRWSPYTNSLLPGHLRLPRGFKRLSLPHIRGVRQMTNSLRRYRPCWFSRATCRGLLV